MGATLECRLSDKCTKQKVSSETTNGLYVGFIPCRQMLHKAAVIGNRLHNPSSRLLYVTTQQRVLTATTSRALQPYKNCGRGLCLKFQFKMMSTFPDGKMLPLHPAMATREEWQGCCLSGPGGLVRSAVTMDRVVLPHASLNTWALITDLYTVCARMLRVLALKQTCFTIHIRNRVSPEGYLFCLLHRAFESFSFLF